MCVCGQLTPQHQHATRFPNFFSHFAKRVRPLPPFSCLSSITAFLNSTSSRKDGLRLTVFHKNRTCCCSTPSSLIQFSILASCCSRKLRAVPPVRPSVAPNLHIFTMDSVTANSDDLLSGFVRWLHVQGSVKVLTLGDAGAACRRVELGSHWTRHESCVSRKVDGCLRRVARFGRHVKETHTAGTQLRDTDLGKCLLS